MDLDNLTPVTSEPSASSSKDGATIYVIPASGYPYTAVCMKASDGSYEWVMIAPGYE